MVAHDTRLTSAGHRTADAFISLALTQRRLAHQAKREAIEAEHKGDLKRYRQMRAEAERLWVEAKWNLNFSRDWSPS